MERSLEALQLKIPCWFNNKMSMKKQWLILVLKNNIGALFISFYSGKTGRDLEQGQHCLH